MDFAGFAKIVQKKNQILDKVHRYSTVRTCRTITLCVLFFAQVYQAQLAFCAITTLLSLILKNYYSFFMIKT